MDSIRFWNQHIKQQIDSFFLNKFSLKINEKIEKKTSVDVKHFLDTITVCAKFLFFFLWILTENFPFQSTVIDVNQICVLGFYFNLEM